MAEKLNRLAQYWPDSANTGTLDKGLRMSALKESLTERTATLVRQAIAARWKDTDRQLHETAGISSTSLTNLKMRGATHVTPSLRKLCRVLRIDPHRLVAGKIIDAVEPAKPSKSTLHSLADRIVGTADELIAERMLRSLIDARN